MRSQINPEKDATVLRFGPGGDFQHTWGGGDSTLCYSDSGIYGQIGCVMGGFLLFLARLYRWLRDKNNGGSAQKMAANVTVPIQIETRLTVPVLKACRSVTNWRCSNDPGKTEKNLRHDYTDAASVRNSPLDRRISPQEWLFPDLAGDCRKTSVKQSHYLRARRSPRRKKDFAASAQQGTLFDN